MGDKIPIIYRHSWNNQQFTNYLKCLLYYMKQRSQVYIFVASALLSLAVASRGMVEPILAIKLASGTYMISLATYAYNDVTDTIADRVNKVDRVLARGRMDGKTVERLSIALFSTGMILLVHINVYTAIIALLCTALAVVYSHPKTNLKDRFPYKTIVNASGAGLAALIGGFAVGDISSVMVLAIVSFLFLFILAPLGDIQDYHGDRVAGKRTFPVVLGINATMAMMLPIPSIVMLMLWISMSINMLSMVITSIANVVSTTIILVVYKKVHDRAVVRISRHILRLMYVMNQVSIMLSSKTW